MAAARDLTRENEGGNITACKTGTTLVRFETAGTSGASGGVSYTIGTDGKLTFTTTGVLVVEALIKGGAGTNIYDYSGATAGFAGPGIAHDDGLVGPLGAISNVGFCVIAPPTGDLLINKTSGASTALPGVTFTLTGTGFTTRTDVTDASGQANFDDLPPGTYTLTETTPAGHQPAGPWTVTVSAAGVVTVSGLTANPNGSFNIANQLIVTVPPTGDLLINKTSGASAALAGVTFTLTGTGFTTRVDVTDASGQANFDDLPPGTYTLTETTPADFQPAGPWTVTVSATGVVSVSGLTPNQDGSFTIANQLVPPTGDLLINKTSGASAALPGVTFTLTGTGFTTRTDVTDASGQANFDDLTPGTYTLTETTPADFQPAGPWTVTVSATGVVTVSGLTANANGSFTILNTRTGTLSGTPTPTPTPTPAPVRQGTLTSTGVPNTAASLETAGLTGAGLLGLLMVAGAGAFVFANVLTARRRR